METIELDGISRTRLASELYNRQELEQTAVRLVESRQEPEHDNWQMEPEINARTAIFEELTAKGHLSRVEFSEPAEVANERALRRLVNGWSDNLPSWEMERRLNEVVEELSIHCVWDDIKSGYLPEDTIVITISDFPETCPDEEAPIIGYRALNKKGMVRVTEFGNGRRTIEQVSRSNSNDGSSELFFESNGLAGVSGSSKVLASQIIARKRDFPDGVVDVQRALDSLAGPNVVYGEHRSQKNSNLPEYEDLRSVSEERERQAERFIELLARHERDLNVLYKAGRITYSEKLSSINQRRRQLVDEICVIDPSYARDARGEASVIHFEQASLAMASGNHGAGISHLETALAVSDKSAGVVCGGDVHENVVKTQSSKAAETYTEATLERKNWKWKKGVCIVKECPTRPDKTEVGPCGVCRKCQGIFDHGRNPGRVYKTAGFWETIMKPLSQPSSRKYHQKKG